MNQDKNVKPEDATPIVEDIDETSSADSQSVDDEPVSFVQTPPSEMELDSGEGSASEAASAELDALAALTQERDEYLNDLKRLQAEFDNFRKRSAKERTELREYLLQEVFTRLLDVADNLGRAGQSSGAEENMESFQQGVTMIHQQFMSIMSDYGVQRIESEGQPFDPTMHEAVGQIESEDHAPGTVVSEFMPGYQLKERVLRAPKVQIAIAPASTEEATSQTETEETAPDESGT